MGNFPSRFRDLGCVCRDLALRASPSTHMNVIVKPYIDDVSDKSLRLVYNQNWNKIKAFFTSCSTSQALAQ